MFIELSITEERARAEALSDALLDAGALSASIEDADVGSEDEQPLYGEPGAVIATSAWKRSRVVALFDDTIDIDRALDGAGAQAGLVAPAWQRREVADENWVQLTQAQFDPIRIGARLWVVPSWHASPAAAQAADSIVLKLDPGMAFGTGDHPTTRLCLAWLDACLPPQATVIDYGCGSGILAIAASKLGAGRVVGTDIDEQAVVAARRNAADNDVRIDFTVSSSFASDPADVVVANILSNPLKVLAPLLTSLVARDGWLVLSGVLERQWREVAQVYAPQVSLAPWRSDEGWVCLAGRRRVEGA